MLDGKDLTFVGDRSFVESTPCTNSFVGINIQLNGEMNVLKSLLRKK
jgi:hypothetical protein